MKSTFLSFFRYSQILLYIPNGLLFTYFEPVNFSASFSLNAKLNLKSPAIKEQLQTIPPFLINVFAISAANPPDDDFALISSDFAQP